MERTFNKDKYNFVINIAHWFVKAFIIFLYIVFSLLIIGLVAVLFIPENLLSFDLSNIQHINVQVYNVLLEIDDSIFDGLINAKDILMMLSLTGSIYIAFIIFVLTNLKKLISSVKEDTPFIEKNSVLLRNMGIGFLVASIVLPQLNGFTMQTIANTFNIFDSVDINFTINTQYVFMGVLILILAYVFSYGAFLQEEHDTTI